MDRAATDKPATQPDARAQAFVKARLKAEAVKTYPGAKPDTLDAAYAIQNAAIDLFPDRLSGWKVGGVNGPWRDTLGVSRLVGPVFETYTHDNRDGVLDMPIFADGFAAVEAEVVVVIGKDVAAGRTQFSTEDALDHIASVHVGVEIASSPFPGINEHGPLVTISDFGNNRGLIIGAKIDGGRAFEIADWTFETELNGKQIGMGIPDGMPGGPVESVRYALENTASRGFPMKAGMKILTGAVTGVHQAHAGDTSRILFRGRDAIRCRLVRLDMHETVA